MVRYRFSGILCFRLQDRCRQKVGKYLFFICHLTIIAGSLAADQKGMGLLLAMCS